MLKKSEQTNKQTIIYWFSRHKQKVKRMSITDLSYDADRTRDDAGRQVICPKCLYRWRYIGQALYGLYCPKCKKKMDLDSKSFKQTNGDF
jgi:transcription initiation factor IIE alpha subunit